MIIVLITLILVFLFIIFLKNREDDFNNNLDKFKILKQCFDNSDTSPFFTKYNIITACDIKDNNIACYTPLEYIDEINEQNAANGHLLHNICVDPKMRNTGIATTLIYKQIEKAKKMGKNFCMLQVDALNKPAVNLYKKLGFDIKTKFNSTDSKYYYNMVYLIPTQHP
jgi:ribosomal protein S18 acetylase RimI-like enzyme